MATTTFVARETLVSADWLNDINDHVYEQYISIKVYGAVANGITNDSTALGNALSSGYKIIDGHGLTCKINSALTIPTGVTLRNINLVAGTNGMNMVLVNTGSRLENVKLTGTGTVSTTERGVYPATTGVSNVYLDVEVTNMTFGVHAAPTGTASYANNPRKWFGRVYAHDIVGTVGASEGYGLLLESAEECMFEVVAKTIARHAVYLSAGARDNDIKATVDDCGNYAVQLYSTSSQTATNYNTILVNARNLTEDTAGSGGAVAIVQKAHYNTVTVNLEGNNTTSYGILVEGASGGPYPLGNKIINSNITGQFVGQYVVRLLNADSTHVQNNTLHCYATAGVIGLLRTGTNGIVHGGYVEGNEINCQGQAIKGIYDEINTVPSYVGANEITNNSTATRVDDATSGYRYGFSRRVRFSGTTASITNGTTGDTAPTLARAVQITGRRRNVHITGASVNLTSNSGVVAVLTPASETEDNFRIYNGHSGAQTFNYEGWVEGD